jgi:para-nitrobenzyl esterase
VRDNIERFGGDPTRVTAFGQSGGGGKVSTLYGMPAAKGLFHRGIAMSGSQVRSNTTDRATQTARNLMRKLNVTTADQLQQVDWRALRAAIPGTGGYGPVVDGGALPAHIFDPTASAISANVPMMIGSTETEVTWNTNQHYDHLTDAQLREDVMETLRTDAAGADQAIAVYKKNHPRASNLDVFLILATDGSNFRTGTDTQADRKAAAGGAPVYKYYFEWYSPVRNGELRSMHTMDIAFAFENVNVATTLLGSAPDVQRLADRMSAAWVTFAREGNPNNSLIPEWPTFTAAQKATMVWNDDTRVVNDPRGDEKAVVAAVRDRARRGAADSSN